MHSDALKMMNPLETDRLDQLLGGLELQFTQAGASSVSFRQANNERCQTSSPPPAEDAVHRQSRDRAKLVRAGGRPIMSTKQLGPLSTMTEKSIERAALWLDLPKKDHAAYHKILPLFSKQLEHWSTFQQYWQWGNRGAAGRDKGFAAFLASMRQNYLDKGETEAVEDVASFEGMARRMWQYEQPRQTASSTNTESFASYVRAMKKRFESHGFTGHFSLSKDPGEQDEWTTWVEYLSYIYWETDNDAATMRRSEPRYRRAMGELLLGGEGRSLETDQDTPLQQQLETTKDALRKQRARLNAMRQNAKDYLTHEALVHRGQLRAEWVLEELALIEKGDSVKKEEGGKPSTAGTEDEVEGVDMQASTITATSDSINGNRRQLRKRQRNDGDEEKGAAMDVNAQDAEAAPPPLKRSPTRGSRSFASSGPATSATNAPPKRKLRGSQRSQNGGSDAVTRDAQHTDAEAAAIFTGVRPTRARNSRTVK